MSSQIIMLEGCSQLMDKFKFDKILLHKLSKLTHVIRMILFCFIQIKQFSIALHWVLWGVCHKKAFNETSSLLFIVTIIYFIDGLVYFVQWIYKEQTFSGYVRTLATSSGTATWIQAENKKINNHSHRWNFIFQSLKYIIEKIMSWK